MRRQPPLRRLLALVGAARDFLASAEPPPVAGAILMLAAPDASHATKGGVDEEEGRASWWLFQFLAILLELVLGLFVFGRMRRSSAAKGAAWRSCVVGYLLIWPEIPLVAAAAATSVRDYAITKSSKIKTNESPSSSVQSLEQRRELSSYVMDDTLIRPTIIAWFDDRAAVDHHHCPRHRRARACRRRCVPILEEEERYGRHEGRARPVQKLCLRRRRRCRCGHRR